MDQKSHESHPSMGEKRRMRGGAIFHKQTFELNGGGEKDLWEGLPRQGGASGGEQHS